jgi:hypothetical protein
MTWRVAQAWVLISLALQTKGVPHPFAYLLSPVCVTRHTMPRLRAVPARADDGM